MNEASTPDASPAKAEVALPVRRSRRKAWALGLGALLCLALLAVSLALPRLERLFLQRLGTEAEATQTLVREVLRGELDRAAPLPALMAERPILRQVLAEPENQGLLPFVNEQLRQSAMALDVSHIYLLDRTGRTVASSNYRSELSFVGRNFGYRPYFTRALAGEPARFHAVGTTTGQRGYFFAAPVIEGLEIVGVLAVKVTLDGFEENWRQGAYSVLVTDSNDVVFLSDRIDWHLALIDTLSEEGRAEITRTRQYPLAQLRGLDLERAPLSDSLDEVSIATGAPEGGAQHYVAHTGLIAAAGWRVTVLIPTGLALTQARQALALIVLALLIAGLITALFVQRRAQLMDRLAVQRQARRMLEHRVADRTADLARANAQLRQEVAERSAAEARLRATQAELVQAGKLAALGQMSAALSHEFNQPLSAVKAYADNAATFLERGQEDQAARNIGLISAMTDRMAKISKHLRNFARKPSEKTGPIPLIDTLEDALALMQPRLDAAGAVVEFDRSPEGITDPHRIHVTGGRVRLSQVVVNLIANALDAMQEQEQPRLELRLSPRPDGWRVSLRDHGPGFAGGGAAPNEIFDPFYSTKTPVSGDTDGEGLGLGLSISYNIMRDFGGSLWAQAHPEGGAVFHADLVAAEVPARPVQTDMAAE
ncbi:MAG: ATP-binding protein [Pseudomonadota bacterium]